jgi:protein-S-isoprenylcysteine O-methyltransferase Ste14
MFTIRLILFFIVCLFCEAFLVSFKPVLRQSRERFRVNSPFNMRLHMVTIPPEEEKTRVNAETEFNDVIRTIKDRFNTAIQNSKVETSISGAAKGETWLILQITCVGSVFLGTALMNPFLGWSLNLASSGFLLFGTLLFVGAIKELGNDISFLSPPVSTSLKTQGAYNIVRHPMYSSAFFLCAGFALLTMDTWRILATLVLLYASNKRAENEELYLRDKFGEEYQEYENKVLDKLIPLWL